MINCSIAVYTQICRRYESAQVNYSQLYINLYTAYNLWYRKITGTNNDRTALDFIKRQTALWHEYLDGKVMGELSLYMQMIVEYTQREPLKTISSSWSGSVDNPHDWRSLIEFWYQVRCLVVHGEDIDSQYVHLAYCSLNVFMRELISGTLHKSAGINKPVSARRV